MKRKFTKKPITASWTAAYKQMEEVFDPLWNDEVVFYETHGDTSERGPAMQAVYDLYRKHKGEADWDEAYRRFTEPKHDVDGAIMATKIFGQDAGMILEVFQDAVDEIEIPEGYNWDYKIDQLDSGETAGQLFIMTDDNQPVYFVTFSLEKDGQPLAILNDKKIYDSLVKQVKKSLNKLGDFEEYVGKPKQETIELATKIKAKHKFCISPQTVTASIYTKGLTVQDDMWLFIFIYDWYQEYNEFPWWQDIVDEFGETVSKAEYEDACTRLEAVVDDIQYYDYDYQRYIELSDNRTLLDIEVSDTLAKELGDEYIGQIYVDQLDIAKEQFESITGEELYFLGRNGRHVCVDNTVENALKHSYLRQTAIELEQKVVDYMNNLEEMCP